MHIDCMSFNIMLNSRFEKYGPTVSQFGSQVCVTGSHQKLTLKTFKKQILSNFYSSQHQTWTISSIFSLHSNLQYSNSKDLIDLTLRISVGLNIWPLYSSLNSYLALKTNEESRNYYKSLFLGSHQMCYLVKFIFWVPPIYTPSRPLSMKK